MPEINFEHNVIKLTLALQARGVEFDSGLSDAEIELVEARFGFVFPVDLRFLLQTALPVSANWVNWRSDSEDTIRNRLKWPLEGILFDVDHNEFWLEEWGAKPSETEAANRIVKLYFREAPVLIPLYSHRYLPAMPQSGGAPVLSIHQTDIIYYGYNLVDYFAKEFSDEALTRRGTAALGPNLPPFPEVALDMIEVPFWPGFIGSIWRRQPS